MTTPVIVIPDQGPIGVQVNTGTPGPAGPSGGVVHLAARDPGVNDDTTQGYVVGSSWLNTNAPVRFWVAQSVGTGAAVWKEPVQDSLQTAGGSMGGALVTAGLGLAASLLSDANYQIAGTDCVLIPSALSASRTWTLPASSGKQFLVAADIARVVGTFGISVQPPGGAHLNGGTGAVSALATVGSCAVFFTDGGGNWIMAQFGGGGSTMTPQILTAGTGQTITAPAGATVVDAYVWGAGGSGGGGRRGPSGEASVGGGGGASGAYSHAVIPLSQLGTTFKVDVGAGATGGAAATADSTNGGAGNKGGDTKIYTTPGNVVVLAAFGAGTGGLTAGGGGSATGGAAGGAYNSAAGGQEAGFGGGAASTAGSTGGSGQGAGSGQTPAPHAGTGGGAGGGIDTGNTAHNGGAGGTGQGFAFPEGQTNSAGGVVGGSAPATVPLPATSMSMGGLGGGGGAGNASGVGQNGAAGATPGGGGGGGGASRNGNNSGAGGNGGDGLAILIFS